MHGRSDDVPAQRVRPRTIMLWTMIVTIVAFTLRMLFLASSADRAWPHSLWYEGDGPIYAEYSLHLHEGTPFEFGLPIHAPAVGYVLHWLYPAGNASRVGPDPQAVQFHGFVAAKVVWSALSSIACGLLVLTSVRAIGLRASVIAGSLLAASFGQIVTATSLNSECLYTLLVVAIAAAAFRMQVSPTWRWAAPLGVLHALATLVRPEHTLFVLLHGAWIVTTGWKPRRRALAIVTIMGVAMLATLTPWTVHAQRAVSRFNTLMIEEPRFEHARMRWTDDGRAFIANLPAFAQSDNVDFITAAAASQGLTEVDAATAERLLRETFGSVPRPLSPYVLVSNQGALSFALANHPDADGGFTRNAFGHPLLGPNPKFKFPFPPHLEVMNDGYRLGWRWIREDPMRWLRLVGRKLDRFGDGAALGFGSGNAPLGVTGRRHAVDLFTNEPGAFAVLWKFGVFGVIGAGVVLMLRRGTLTSGGTFWLLLIAYKFIVTVLFYGYARQAVSIGPAFAVLAAIPFDALFANVLDRARWWREWRMPVLCAMTIVFMGWEVRSALLRQPPLVKSAALTRSSRFGANAFECTERLDIVPRDARTIVEGGFTP